MSILTIILFFVYMWGLGFTVTFFLKLENFIERNVVRLGLGLASLPVIISLMGLLRIPIDWRIILFLSLIGPSLYLVKSYKKGLGFSKLSLKKSSIYFLLVLILFSFTLFMYTKGAFSYPYLENDDPWGHALSIKYIALEKTIYEPSTTSYLFNYLDARPPGYDGLIAILHQTSPSLQWTMKFFNALIISLGILFFYVFATKLLKRRDMALFSTFVLAMTPSYLSHFIWSHSLAITLFIPALTCILYAVKDKKWIAPAIIVTSSILLTQETQSIKFGIILVLFFGVFSIAKKKVNWNIVISSFGGLTLASVLWWIPIVVRYGGFKDAWKLGINHGFVATAGANKYFHPSIKKLYYGSIGSATRQHGLYTISDFLFPKAQNMINVPIGTGWVIILLILLGLTYIIMKRKWWLNQDGAHYLLLFLLLAFSFFGIHGGVRWWSPLALYSFRFWLLFAIFGSLVAAYGLWVLFSLFKKNHVTKLILLSFVLIGIIITSGLPKYKLNTAVWGPGGSWSSQSELQGYVWIKQNLDPDSRIFDANLDMFSLGSDMFSCYWCLDEMEYKATIINETADDLWGWLKDNKYDYFIIGPRNFKQYGENLTLNFRDSIIDSNYFSPIISNQDFYLFKIK